MDYRTTGLSSRDWIKFIVFSLKLSAAKADEYARNQATIPLPATTGMTTDDYCETAEILRKFITGSERG
jgi:hypothetical protein